MSQYRYFWGSDVGLPPVDEGDDVYALDHENKNVGRLRIMPLDTEDREGIFYRAMHINVHEDHRRRGIGQQMLHIAQQRYPHLRGPSDRSDDGVLWGRAMNQRPDVTRIYPDPRVTPAD